MNVYLRNGVIALIANIVVFIIGWGCIVPDTVNDNTHLFGLVGDIEIVRGNTATVFGICCVMSTLTLIISLVEAIVEDYRPCRFNPATRAEKPRKAPKISGMRIADPTSENNGEDPKTPILD